MARSSFDGGSLSQGASLTNLTAPLLPGSVQHKTMPQEADFYSFDPTRQIPRIDVIPVLEPFSIKDLAL